MRIKLLLEKIASNEKLKSSLEKISNLPTDYLIDALVTELEQATERYKDMSIYAGQARSAAIQLERSSGPDLQAKPSSPDLHAKPSSPNLAKASSPDPAKASSPDPAKPSSPDLAKPLPRPEQQTPSNPLRVDPIKIELPTMRLPETAVAFLEKKEAVKPLMRKELESIEQAMSVEIQRDWDSREHEIHERVLSLKNSQELLRKETVPSPVKETVPSSVKETPRSNTEIKNPGEPVRPEQEMTDDDLFYLHAIELPETYKEKQSPGKYPATIGIDGKHNILEYRLDGHTFLLSKTSADSMTLTTSGLMLLPKQESERLRGRHEEILNTLRTHKPLAPFAFGTVVRGREELLKKCGELGSTLRNAVKQEAQTKVWTLKLYALDASIEKAFGEKETAWHGREGRTREHVKRSDIKVLEKILHHEKKIAEAVHHILTLHSSSASVAFMVSFGQGTSQDWKKIFQASYEMGAEGKKNFFTAVQRLQEEYCKVGLMFSISGATGRIVFSGNSVEAQAVSV